jgi:hypothetical protein
MVFKALNDLNIHIDSQVGGEILIQLWSSFVSPSHLRLGLLRK